MQLQIIGKHLKNLMNVAEGDYTLHQTILGTKIWSTGLVCSLKFSTARSRPNLPQHRTTDWSDQNAFDFWSGGPSTTILLPLLIQWVNIRNSVQNKTPSFDRSQQTENGPYNV
jgi:hypothetical protein